MTLILCTYHIILRNFCVAKNFINNWWNKIFVHTYSHVHVCIVFLRIFVSDGNAKISHYTVYNNIVDVKEQGQCGRSPFPHLTIWGWSVAILSPQRWIPASWLWWVSLSHTLPLSLSLSHTHTHTHTHSLSLSHTHTYTHTPLFLSDTLPLSHTHIHTLPPPHTHTHTPSDYSDERLVSATNADLPNTLGNLLQRISTPRLNPWGPKLEFSPTMFPTWQGSGNSHECRANEEDYVLINNLHDLPGIYNMSQKNVNTHTLPYPPTFRCNLVGFISIGYILRCRLLHDLHDRGR